MSADLQNPIFNDETAAREALEATRWPDGPICPHCGNADGETMPLVKGKKRSHRPGLRYCNACKGQFTVTVGSVFERSKVPLTKWWLATHLLGSSKKGISTHQLHRMLGVTYKTAWFMTMRIREAMKELNPSPLGGRGKVVEADETYFGNVGKSRFKSQFVTGKGWVTIRPHFDQKWKIVGLVERGGRTRMVQVEGLTASQIRKVLVTNADRKSDLMTDESSVYIEVGKEFRQPRIRDTFQQGICPRRGSLKHD